MSKRNISELHHLYLFINPTSLEIILDAQEQSLYLTAKSGKLITSKPHELQNKMGNWICEGYMGLDLLVPYDKEKHIYCDKEIKIYLSSRNKKTIVGIATLNLAQHIKTSSKPSSQTSIPIAYKLQQCIDKNAKIEISISYKLLDTKPNNTGSFSRLKQFSSAKSLEKQNLDPFCVGTSFEESFQRSVVLQRPILIQSNYKRQQNILSRRSSFNFSQKLSPLNQVVVAPVSLETSQSYIIQNLSTITNQCFALRSLLDQPQRNLDLSGIHEQNSYLRQAKQSMKNQIQSLQYLNKVLLQQQSNKEKQIQNLTAQLQKAYSIINKFKGLMQIKAVQDMKNEIQWLRQAKQFSDEEVFRIKLQNDLLVEQNNIIKQNTNQNISQSSLVVCSNNKSVQKQNVTKVNLHTNPKDILRISYEFTKVKQSLMKGSSLENKKKTIKMMRPLQKAIQSLIGEV